MLDDKEIIGGPLPAWSRPRRARQSAARTSAAVEPPGAAPLVDCDEPAAAIRALGQRQRVDCRRVLRYARRVVLAELLVAAIRRWGSDIDTLAAALETSPTSVRNWLRETELEAFFWAERKVS